MSYVVVKNFAAGLDKRKEIYSLDPGALFTCSNAHITRGGEVEKRKAFVPVAILSSDTHGLHEAGDQLYTFTAKDGVTAPPGYRVQKINAKDGSADIDRIIFTENFSGLVYVIARFTNGEVAHFYDGARVSAWDAEVSKLGSNAALAAYLSDLIDAAEEYSSVAAGADIFVTAAEPGTDFSVATTATNGVGTDDQTLTATVLQPNVLADPGQFAQAVVSIVTGTSGSTNKISSIKIGGVEILGTAVLWLTSDNNTAILLANQINSVGPEHGWSASVVGNTVTIISLARTDALNGKAVAVVAEGTVLVSADASTQNGALVVEPVAKVVKLTVGGTYEGDDKFTATLGGRTFSAMGQAAALPLAVKTLSDKVYSVIQSLLFFCALDDPTTIDPTSVTPPGTGAGDINMSNKDGGSQRLTALGIFQNNLVIMSGKAIQIWAMDPDPSKNQKVQVIKNLGTLSPRSVVEMGDLDMFFLAPSGVRSLKVRLATSFATMSDVGTAIDPLVIEDGLALPDETVRNAVGVIEPIDGRYMLAMGNRVYVFSYFPGSKVSAWSTYDLAFAIDYFAVVGGRYVYARSGDGVYLYGGTNLNTYERCVVDVELGYLDGGKPGHGKDFTGADLGISGQWDLHVGTDCSQPDTRAFVGTFTKPSFGLVKVPGAGSGTHFGARLVNDTDGYAKLSNLLAYFTLHDPE